MFDYIKSLFSKKSSNKSDIPSDKKPEMDYLGKCSDLNRYIEQRTAPYYYIQGMKYKSYYNKSEMHRDHIIGVISQHNLHYSYHVNDSLVNDLEAGKAFIDKLIRFLTSEYLVNYIIDDNVFVYDYQKSKYKDTHQSYLFHTINNVTGSNLYKALDYSIIESSIVEANSKYTEQYSINIDTGTIEELKEIVGKLKQRSLDITIDANNIYKWNLKVILHDFPEEMFYIELIGKNQMETILSVNEPVQEISGSIRINGILCRGDFFILVPCVHYKIKCNKITKQQIIHDILNGVIHANT